MSGERRLLIVDDEPHYRELLRDRYNRKEWTTFVAANAAEALNIAQTAGVTVVLLDIMMPGADGLDLLERLKALDPALEGIILTGHAAVDTAIRAMKMGAFDYLSKPYKLGELDILLERALEKRRLALQCVGLRAQIEHMRGWTDERVLGESTAWQATLRLAQKAAAQQAPVLITGETGVGKEVIAAAIHRWSARAAASFVPVNCGALPHDLLESELFGHRRGAFTGAVTDRAGLFDVASSGTLFLDELGELPLPSQVKLLRAMETGEYRPVGQSGLRRTDARIVAATNRDLEVEVRQGRFRQDLFYRMNVLAIRVPPLRERRADITLLLAHFLARSKAAHVQIAPEAMARLLDYPWPGNVRELRNVVERLLMLADGGRVSEMLVASLLSGDRLRPAPTPAAFERVMKLHELERTYAKWAVDACDGNITTAARALGISRSTLYRHIGERPNNAPPRRQDGWPAALPPR